MSKKCISAQKSSTVHKARRARRGHIGYVCTYFNSVEDLEYVVEVLERALEIACIREIDVHFEDAPEEGPIKCKGADMDPDSYIWMAENQLDLGIELEYED